eukprot:SAG31_NODE_3621_length_4059_cov_7.360101_3_plen_223_part_00
MEVGLGAEIWGAAKAMAIWMSAHKADFAGKRVIEIGAGVGFPGLVAAKLGAAVSVITDFSLPLVENMANSVADNDWLPGQQVSAAKLDWDVFLDKNIGTLDRQDAEREHAGKYDYVLLADGVYNPAHPPAIAAAACTMLATGLSKLVIFQAGNLNETTGAFETRNGWAETKQLLATRGTVATCLLQLKRAHGSADMPAPIEGETSQDLEVLEFKKTVLCLEM